MRATSTGARDALHWRLVASITWVSALAAQFRGVSRRMDDVSERMEECLGPRLSRSRTELPLHRREAPLARGSSRTWTRRRWAFMRRARNAATSASG